MDREEFETNIRGKTGVAYFSAAWSKPCLEMKLIMREVDAEYEGKAMVLELDIHFQKKLATDLMVHSIPTQIIFKNGREIKRLVGIQSKAAIRQNLNTALNTRDAKGA